MDMAWNNPITTAQPLGASAADAIIGACLAAAAQGDADAYFDLGVLCSTDDSIVPNDLIEAHKWFNLAASQGHAEAAILRAELAEDMTAREIAEAQRRARQWLATITRRAA